MVKKNAFRPYLLRSLKWIEIARQTIILMINKQEEPSPTPPA